MTRFDLKVESRLLWASIPSGGPLLISYFSSHFSPVIFHQSCLICTSVPSGLLDSTLFGLIHASPRERKLQVRTDFVSRTV
jgi:hypothetical protein